MRSCISFKGREGSCRDLNRVETRRSSLSEKSSSSGIPKPSMMYCTLCNADWNTWGEGRGSGEEREEGERREKGERGEGGGEEGREGEGRERRGGRGGREEGREGRERGREKRDW